MVVVGGGGLVVVVVVVVVRPSSNSVPHFPPLLLLLPQYQHRVKSILHSNYTFIPHLLTNQKKIMEKKTKKGGKKGRGKK